MFLAFDRKFDGLKIVLEGRDVKILKNLQVNQLLVKMRLLHNMLNRIFFSKIGHFDWVTEKGMAFMYYMIKG